VIALESKRENGYRDPHFIIVIEVFKISRRETRELYEEHPCTYIELIEESFDSFSWFVLFLCVYLRYAHECLFLAIHFLLYVVYVISWLN
jgi:hypothetical protein